MRHQIFGEADHVLAVCEDSIQLGEGIFYLLVSDGSDIGIQGLLRNGTGH